MLRKSISMTSFVSFAVMLFTSVVLYIEPHGRVAYWANWKFLGLTKTQWGDLHLTTGILFLVAGIWHIWLNWKPIVSYMKNASRELVVMTKPMIVALVVTIFVCVGTLTGLPPMQQFIDLGGYIKDMQTRTYGNPPYGHAELSKLKKFTDYLGMDAEKAMQALKDAGLDKQVTKQSTILEIATANNVTPKQVYDAMLKGTGGDNPYALLPPSPPEGTGKMVLSDFCASYGLDLDTTISKLEKAGFKATAESTFKQLGNAADVPPVQVYKTIRAFE